MSVVNPEMHDLQEEVAEQRVRLANTEGRIDEVRRTASGTVRQTIWQFVIFTVTMAAVLLGGLNYQTEALRREFNARFDSVNARFDSVNARFDSVNARFDSVNAHFDSVDARFDDMNKRFDSRFDDMNKRFEDLKQVVLSRQKQ